jgi:hypothetical protein
VEVTTADPDHHRAAEQTVRACLERTDWLPDMLEGRYLPRVGDLDTLLDDLEAAPR